jgi:RNase P subunit RPR2
MRHRLLLYDNVTLGNVIVICHIHYVHDKTGDVRGYNVAKDMLIRTCNCCDLVRRYEDQSK